MSKTKNQKELLKEMEQRIESEKSNIRNKKLMVKRLERELEWAKGGDESWL